MPAGEIYVRLSADFADNRKVRALMRYGRDARGIRDLYVQMLCFCKRTRSDGWVADEQLGILAYPDVSAALRDAGRLAEVGLIERGEGGYRVTGWLERNPSRADIERKSQAKARGAKLANHRRWHTEGRGNPDSLCYWCRKEANQATAQTTDQWSDQATDQSGVSSQEETESESSGKTHGRQVGRKTEPGSDDDPEFCAFWSAYPRKEAKGQARATWKTVVVKRGHDPKAIIEGAERFRDDPARRASGKKFTPHPSTWLNGERWLEQLAGPDDDDEPDGHLFYPNSPWDN